MNRKITDKQEAFIQAMLIPDTSQREAYRIAYPNTKMKDKTVDEAASRLYNDGKINARYNELRDKLIKKAENKSIITALGLLTDLKDIIDRNKSEDDRVALDAIKTGMKHLGMLTEKVELEVKEMPKIIIE